MVAASEDGDVLEGTEIHVHADAPIAGVLQGRLDLTAAEVLEARRSSSQARSLSIWLRDAWRSARRVDSGWSCPCRDRRGDTPFQFQEAAMIFDVIGRRHPSADERNSRARSPAAPVGAQQIDQLAPRQRDEMFGESRRFHKGSSSNAGGSFRRITLTTPVLRGDPPAR